MARGLRGHSTPSTTSPACSSTLSGGASYDTYIEDAEQEGDEDLTEFFRTVREEDRDRASEARMLLAERTPTDVRAEEATAGVSPGMEQIGSFPAEGDVTPGSTEQAASPRPEPSDDLPGAEPVRGDVLREMAGGVPPPEEVPPERAGEIPTAEEVPAPRTEEVPSGTPPQAPPGDVQRGSMPEHCTGEALEVEGAGHEERQDRSLIDRLTDRARAGLRGEEEQRREGIDRPGRR